MRRNRRQTIKKNKILFLIGAVIVLSIIVGAVIIKVQSKGAEVANAEIVELTYTSSAVSDTSTEIAEIESEATEDPDNYKYPYNTMSADWGAELYESGFRYYQIPQEYIDGDGCFPEVVQAYLWSICREVGVDYYTVVALIERESKYKYNAVGDNGNSIGYMQIYSKWHTERMKELGVTDLYNPYENIKVGVDTLAEIQEKYLDSSGANCVLMVYNMGESTAKEFWEKGIYSTKYSREVLQRAQEIEQELQE